MTATKKHYLSDHAPEAIEAFWNQIDITPVNEFFAKLLKLPVALEKGVARNYSNKPYYYLSDDTNIAGTNPVIFAAFKKMTITTHGGLEADENTGELYYWASVHLNYDHQGGGSNGAKIGYIRFSKGKWEIESEEERNRKWNN